MNVLATTSNGFIADVSSVEMAALQGFSSINSAGFRPPKIGDVIPIDTLFREGKSFNDDNARLLDTKNNCQAIVDRITALGI